MAYLKFQADQIFDGTQLLPENFVLITDEGGVIDAVVDASEAGGDIQKLAGIISPGFVNCHCHLELSHMKGLIPEQTGLVDFIFKILAHRHFAVDEIVRAVTIAEDEMWAAGIVAVGDICNTPFTIKQKQLKRLAYYNFVEVSGWLNSIADTRFATGLGNYEHFLNVTSQSVIVPHAPYSVSEKLWQLIKPGFAKKTISIHNQETAFEDELFLQASGDFVRMYEMMNIENLEFQPSKKSSLQTYFEKLDNAASILLVHNTFTSLQDVIYAKKQATLQKQLLSFCLCVNANLYIENKLPPVSLLRQMETNIVLGTDSLASNQQLSILSEMKTIQNNFKDISLSEMLTWATINGANALQMQDQLGSFHTGKKPGILLIEGIENGHIHEHSSVKRLV